jgi:mRNA interferase MazF
MPTSDISVPAQWDVVVLPFPYADRLTEKRRPAVIVSKPWLAEKHRIVWAVMVTSADNAGWESDIPITDAAATGPRNPSIIRPAKVATVDVSRIARIAGRLGKRERDALAARLQEIVAAP